MAKARSKPSNKAQPVVQNNDNTNELKGYFKMALTPEQIKELLGKTRTKGDYVIKLNKFIETGESGVCVNDEWMELADKKATTLKQGFENAKDNKEAAEGAELVKVISNEDKVFLINLAAAGVEVAA